MKYKKTRAEAKAAGKPHYFTGKQCLNGHTALRRTTTGECTQCSQAREKARWREQNSDMREKQRRWRAKNPDYHKNRHRRKREEEAGRPMPPACELCGWEGDLCFDHDHATGLFRGWLCTRCNTSLGGLGDTLESLRRAVAYLEQHEKDKNGAAT